jgi:transcriptional regulator with XRE-family HTH domain
MLKESSIALLFKGVTMASETEDTRNSFGWRVMTERKQSRMSQTEVCDRLEKEFGIKITYGALSQIETGETKRFHVEMLFALAKIFNVNPYALLTGEEVGTTKGWSEEAEQIAGMVDQMRPQTRQKVLEDIQSTMRWEQELLRSQQDKLMESQRKVARLLEENINLWSSADRKIADDYIENIGYHRTGPQ